MNTNLTTKQVKSYCKEKLRFLKQFAIYPKDEEIDHMMSLRTEIAIDNCCKSLMDKYM